MQRKRRRSRSRGRPHPTTTPLPVTCSSLALLMILESISENTCLAGCKMRGDGRKVMDFLTGGLHCLKQGTSVIVSSGMLVRLW